MIVIKILFIHLMKRLIELKLMTMIILQHLLNEINTTIYNKLLSFTPDEKCKIIIMDIIYLVVFIYIKNIIKMMKNLMNC